MSEVHKPGLTKQSNKPFKSRHKSKGQIKRAQGKIETVRRNDFKKTTLNESRKDRKNRAKQKQLWKKNNVLQEKRFLQKSLEGPPLSAAIIGLGENCNLDSALKLLVGAAESEQVSVSQTNITTVYVPRFKSRVSFYKMSGRSIMSVIDITKVADIILFVINCGEGIDEIGAETLTVIKAQGLLSSFTLYQGLEEIPLKKRNDFKKDLTKLIEDNIEVKSKILPIDTANDAVQVLRFLSETKLRKIHWREYRPYMLTDKVDFIPYTDPNKNGFGTLLISGYIRGNKLDPNNLILLPDYGEFQLEKVVVHADPYRVKKNDVVAEETVYPDPQKIETLERTNKSGVPNEVSMQERIEIDAPSKPKAVPHGFSSYQAAWIPDEGDFDQAFEEPDQLYEDKMQELNEDAPKEMSILENEENLELDKIDNEKNGNELNDEDDEGSDFVDIDVDNMTIPEYEIGKEDSYEEKEEELTAEQMLEKVKEQEKEDLLFPDEIDISPSVLARDRYQRYRGLKSFRTSPWDPKENLPLDYAKIFQFENPAKTRKVVFSKLTGIEPGKFVTLHIKDVSINILEKRSTDTPLIVGGLMKYEGKISCMNFIIRRHISYTEPVRSKDNIIFHCGFRRYLGNPIFSDHNPACDKFKYRRFLHEDTNIATIYAPIIFPPSPVLYFKDNKYLGSGSVLNIEPDRIIVKKIILTANTLKVHKNKVVAKDMFYNPEDVKYFKPVDLWTKYGRKGHIKESLGTHGLMKCVFDGYIKSQDTICMSLYKRIFPIWAYLPEPIRPNSETEKKNN